MRQSEGQVSREPQPVRTPRIIHQNERIVRGPSRVKVCLGDRIEAKIRFSLSPARWIACCERPHSRASGGTLDVNTSTSGLVLAE